MSSNPASDHRRFASVVRDASTLLDSRPLAYYGDLSPAEQVRSAREIQQLKARIVAHELASARALRDSEAARSQGAASTGALLASTFGGDRRAGDRLVHRAEKLAAAPATEAALGQGLISAGQADVIAATVAGLPKDLPAEQRRTCEDTLIAAAPSLSITDLRRRADRIADVYAPDEVDRIENQRLVERERAAWAKTEFWMVDQHDGTHKGGFVLPDLPAEQLRKMVDVLMAPRNSRLPDDDPVLLAERPTGAQRAGHAFAELVQRYPTDRLPGSTDSHGAQLVVTIDYDTLIGAVVPGTLETGTRISAQEAVRLACDLGVMPMVVNGAALPLHLGRTARLFNRAQRRALAHRDGGCAFPGCDRPPGWCEAHHAGDPWCTGGQTNLDEGVLLCAFHHRLVHTTEWEVRIVDQVPEFLPPAALDPTRRPRRNRGPVSRTPARLTTSVGTGANLEADAWALRVDRGGRIAPPSDG